MGTLVFTHPMITTPGKSDTQALVVTTGADQIGWTYGLNTRHYPTYGGEVIQILSCYINNLQIGGTCAAYTTGDYANPGIEEIYSWFLLYMQVASQGAIGTGAYSEYPITCNYVDRGWQIQFQCLTAPAFNLSRDLVAPTWQITGQVVAAPEPMRNFTLNTVFFGNDATEFGMMHDGVDLTQPDPALNPYQSPFPNKSAKVQQNNISKAIGKLGSYWAGLISAWDGGDYSDITGSTQQNVANSSQFLNGAAAKQAQKISGTTGNDSGN
jgi:hypothetical protein